MYLTLLSNKNRKKTVGFTLIELLVAMGIAAILSVIVLESYQVSMNVGRHTLYSANISKNTASLQSYINYLVTNAGAALVPEQSIRTYNDVDCSATEAFINTICNSGFPRLNPEKNDVLAVAYGLPFTATNVVDMTRYAAQLVGASGTSFTLSKGSPLDSVVGTTLENLYINRVFMVYSFTTPSAAYLGYISDLSSTGTPPDVSVVVRYSNLRFTSPFSNNIYPDVASVYGSPGNNAKMVMVNVEAIYLDENGNIVDAFWGPGGNIITRTLASGVEVLQMKYFIDGVGWQDTVGANDYRSVQKLRIGIAFSNYYKYMKRCESYEHKVYIFGKEYEIHASDDWDFGDPCSFYKITYFEFPFKSIRSFVTALGG